MRTRSVVAALVVSFVSACFSGGKHDSQPLQSQTPAPPPPSVDYSAVLANPLAFLPADSEVVVGLDIDGVRASPWWPPLAARLATAMGHQFDDFKRECGTDPMLTVHSMTVGLRNLSPGPPTGVVVIRGLDRANLMSCMQRQLAKAGPNSKVSIDAGIVTITSADSHVVYAFVDASTAVALISPTAKRADLEGVLASKVPLETSPAFTELASHVDFHATLWTIMNGNARFFDQAAAMGIRPKAVLANATLHAGLALDIRLRLESADKATSLAQMAQGQVGAVRAMVDKVDVSSDGPDVIGSVQMSDQQLSQLLSLAGVNLNP